MTPKQENRISDVHSEETDREDALDDVISTLQGVSDALCYRISVENDDMLAMLAEAIDSQVGVLKTLL